MIEFDKCDGGLPCMCPTTGCKKGQCARRLHPQAGRVGKLSTACTLGMGCVQAGVCYAAAHGEPDRCDASFRPIDGNPANTALENWFPFSAEELSRLQRQWSPKWIPTAERLPEPNTIVLTYQKALPGGKRDHFVVDYQSEGYGD